MPRKTTTRRKTASGPPPREPQPVRMSPEWTDEINARIEDIASGRGELISGEEVNDGIERPLGIRRRVVAQYRSSNPGGPVCEARRPTVDELRAAAFALASDEQTALAQELMENARPPDPEWEAALARELEQAVADIDAGREKLVPGEHVLAELRARHLRPSLSVLLCAEGGFDRAHAVELGLAATGDTVGAALAELSRMVLDYYAEAEAHGDPSRLSINPRPDIVRRHARARRRMLRRQAPEGDRITALEMPSDKDIAKRAASRGRPREDGEDVAEDES